MLVVSPSVSVRPVWASDDLTLSAVGISEEQMKNLFPSAQIETLFGGGKVRLLHPTPAEQQAASSALWLLWFFGRRAMTQGEALNDFLRAACRTFSEVALHAESVAEQTAKRGPEILRTFLQHVVHFALTERRVSKYAEWQFITRKHLSDVVRQESGEPPLVHIDRAVVAEAKRLLRDGRRTALQVSEELHFKNYSTFCNTFKRVEGVPPTEWLAARGMG